MKYFQYGKRESDIIKGIAIIMMFWHHFFCFPAWISKTNMYIGIHIHGISPEFILAGFCKVCVGLFAFTTGYAMFVNKKRYERCRYCILKAFQFLIQYWIIMIIFFILGVLIDEPLPTLKTFILQSFGVHTMTGFNWNYNTSIHPVFAWYVSFYLLFLILHPLLIKLSKLNFWIDNIVYAIFFGGIYFFIVYHPIVELPFDIMKVTSNFAIWGYIGMIGYLFAKHDMFSKIDNVIRKHVNPTILVSVSMLSVLAIIVVRQKLGFYICNILAWDAIWTPILIYALINIINYINKGWLEKVLLKLGKYSMNMWFLHGIFFSPNHNIQWVAYFPKYPILILIWTLLIMFLCTIPVSKLQDYIIERINILVNKIQT